VRRARFLLDEDTPHAIRSQLLRRAPRIEIRAVGGDLAPRIGSSDSEILRWIEQEGFLLISRNRRTMPRHLREHLDAGGHVPGVFLIRPNQPVGQVIEDMLLIWEAGDPEGVADRIEYPPPL
jgi:hypothetical protein